MAKDDWGDRPPLAAAKTKPVGVHRKLMDARLELQGRKLNKSGHNKFAGYYYFELGDFLPAIQDIFAGIGLCGVISYGKDEAWLTITDMDDGSSIAVCSPMSSAALKGCHEVQNLGAVQTYIRRYLWVTAMEIVEHDALDATTGQDKKESTKPAPKQYQASGAGVKEEAYDKLTDAERIFVDDLAGEVTLNHGDGATAALLVSGITDALDKHTADGKSDRQELKLALWWRLPSNVRSFIDSKEKGIRAGEKRKDDPVRAAA